MGIQFLCNLGVVLLAGMEALTGFVLITWPASYFYLEMTPDAETAVQRS